jgi:hypothetical protein
MTHKVSMVKCKKICNNGFLSLIKIIKKSLYSFYLKTAKRHEPEIQVLPHSQPISYISSPALGLFSCLHHRVKAVLLHPHPLVNPTCTLNHVLR